MAAIQPTKAPVSSGRMVRKLLESQVWMKYRRTGQLAANTRIATQRSGTTLGQLTNTSKTVSSGKNTNAARQAMCRAETMLNTNQFLGVGRAGVGELRFVQSVSGGSYGFIRSFASAF